ncbi:ubiquitin carboxyl-terminal hydrolase Usp2-like [Sabethes cyaneus]|uniref:ubiquitin carboxyl-terminal hydrolase Usp2-like n=1 Tax=Sabethes cyaneus TaxID=53552 RepID=UPI00237D9409|nr:ubiquitin carboxyl-terminal hydrolase Usp2-like [Sabethes cyaneus]XP_053682631.1 ubiquitin carboxyl-terminal hydrolase Usp2-like [Sabethes cyaneus]XP_053682632.1 ubiquitin carboxyl-terminal hydrolase Usp2-like [Sabethes cyaneus]XP_053682633.1 ubiquitin carboxyl-terminal hydrolase Usp2-like [Sabethes cyaneus]XP_053682634.1 ubiquitin carboxyl-terminal hydrolase Usp2-like [Sabethes cyaneus]
MPVISAYSTSGSSYISPSYRYRSSLSDRKSYTTSSSTSSSIYRRSSYRYELPSTSSAYSSYRSDRTTDAELSATLSTLATKDTAVESSTAPITAATTTVNSTNRPSRYSSAYSYNSLSSAPIRDYSTRFSSRSSDTRLKDRDNNCLCTGGAGSSSNYISNLRSTALSGAELYQKYSVSTYKPSSLESRISSRTTAADSVTKSPISTTLKASSPTALDISKVNNIPAKDKNSNINVAVVISNNNNPTNTSNGHTGVANNPVTNCKLTTARNTGAKPENLARFPHSHSNASTGITGTTVVTTTTTTITTTTSSTSVLLSSSSSSSVLYETAAVSLEATRSRKPGSVPAVLKNTLNKLRPSGGKPPVPKSAFTSNSSSDLASVSISERKQLLGLSSYRNQNFLKHECDLVKRELSKSATEIAVKKGSNQTPNKPVSTIGSATSLLSSADNSKDRSSSILSKLEVSKTRQLLPPVSSSSIASKPGQPKDHEDDDMKNHQHNSQNATTTTTITTTSNRSQPSSAKQPFTTSTSNSGVELKPIDRPAVPTILQSTQRNDTSLFKSSPLSSNTCTITTTTTTRTTTFTKTANTESLTSACMPSSSSAVRTTACTYPTNSRSATDTAMKSLHITTELEESITQATIKLRPTVNGASNGAVGGHRLIATASSTTDDMSDNDYHHVTATIRIKPKSSISHHSTSSSSSSSSTNGSTASINNINNNNNNNNNANHCGHGSSSDDEHEFPNGNVSIHSNNNNNKNNNGVEGDGNDDASDDDDINEATTVVTNSVDKESKVNDDDRKVSYLRSGTTSKSIHSTSPVGYRSRDYDSGLGSYRSGLSNSSPSASVQKPSYNDRANGEDGGSRKEGLCGLWNIGNTCFMNSVIQCLSHTRELTNFLRMQPTSERGTTKDHKILAEYTKLIKDMWNGVNRSVNPSELKYAFSSKHRMYSGSAQQDAQEFLRFFIDSLHSALNVSVKREPISREIEDDDLNNRIKATMMWEWYSKVENSVIKDLFVGLLRSTLKCTVCNSASVTFDPFWDLSLPLPSTNSRCKLENCLDMFVKEEVMDGIDQPTCSKCKTRRKCTKSLTIERFPKYLVIHLKRFSETRWSKLTNVIEFPTGERELNLQPYASEDNTAPVYYSLYGISNHMGSTAGGHYIAVCKHPVSKEWHEFNDNFVSETSERSLVTSSAYVLFYERA